MDCDDLTFFNPYAEVLQTENHLRHWQQKGATYFVTFRLADSLPRETTDRWRRERESWLIHHPTPWSEGDESEYRKRFLAPWEKGLDSGMGECVLGDVDVAELVANVLGYFDGERCAMISWVIMPNHVHALFVLNPGIALEKLMHSWKSFSASKVNELLGRSGAVWQKDYFDRLVRDRGHFSNCVRYIRRNPEKAGLGNGDFLLFESEIAKGVE
jgi:REP element-mobilizing transposase RayT